MATKRIKWVNRTTPAGDTASILAIVETVVASTATAYLALRFGTLHLTISALIAPFLLLRTPQSTLLGLDIAADLQFNTSFIMDVTEGDRLAHPAITAIRIALYGLILGLIALLSRVVATVSTFCRHPLLSLREIPTNWWRFVAIIDSTTPVEAVPGVRGHLHPLSDLDLFDTTEVYAGFLAKSASIIDAILKVVAFVTYTTLVFIPAFAYRLSLKSTTLVYGPIIYLVQTSLRRDTLDILIDIRDLALSRILRLYATLIILLFIGKVYLYMSWARVATKWDSIPGVEVVDAYVLPTHIAPWHVASVVNAVIAWGLFFLADFALSSEQRRGCLVGNRMAFGNAIAIVLLCRGLLSLYTIACVLYISAALLPEIQWPPLGPKIFPWTD
ncbi:MAG: hypothetical protein P1U82_27250 [Verrucomicrobiales bacterium]|nr:hypothetical protein [Verrucomicrobiales bacterium]